MCIEISLSIRECNIFFIIATEILQLYFSLCFNYWATKRPLVVVWWLVHSLYLNGKSRVQDRLVHWPRQTQDVKIDSNSFFATSFPFGSMSHWYFGWNLKYRRPVWWDKEPSMIRPLASCMGFNSWHFTYSW